MKITCIIVDDSEHAVLGLRSYVEKVDFLELVAVFDNGLEAYSYIAKNRIDLIFLDVQMPHMSGIELLQSLVKIPLVIFTTAHRDYALDAFEFSALDFLLKPITFPRFLQAVHKAKEAIAPNANHSSEYCFFRSDGAYVKVNMNDICFIEAKKDYVTIHTKLDRYDAWMNLKTITEKLPSDKFIRTHKSFVVSIQRIARIDNENVILLTNGSSIPLGLTYKDSLKKLIEFNLVK